MMAYRKLGRVAVVAAALAAASHTPSAGPTGAPAARELVSSLNSLTGGALSAVEVDRWASRLAEDGHDAERLIDELVDRPEFGRDLLPTLIFGTYLNVRNYYALPTGFIMQQTDQPDEHGRVLYYIRKPCQPAEAVPVRPWWDPDREVMVCPDAYRPERWRISPETKGFHSSSFLACDSQVGSPENEVSPQCGCGPALIRCVRDQTQYYEFHDSMKREVERTVQHVVEHDLPAEEIFTSNATFRDRNAELYYRRQKIGSLELADVDKVLADLDTWPADGQWAPREEIAPGQHAGVLTTPQLLHANPDRRQRQRAFYEMMWCEGRNSFGATTQQVLDLNRGSANLAFVHDSWKRLASTPLCTNCHARLDYGFQFFLGYPDSRASLYYVPSLTRPGKGPLYGADISDERGQATLTPRGFAESTVKQPEFARCMSRHLVTHVLGPDATAADQESVRADLLRRHSFKNAMRVALRLYVARWKAPEPDPVAPVAAAPARRLLSAERAATARSPARVAITPPLRKQLDEFCTDCHAKVPYVDSSVSVGLAFDLTGDSLPRELVVRMADHVAYGKMPKLPVEMTAAQRDALVGALIEDLWTDPAARAEAADYYLHQDRGLPVEPIDSAFRLIQRAAGSPAADTDSGDKAGRASAGSADGGVAVATGADGDAGPASPEADDGKSWGLLERGLWIDQASFTPSFAAAVALEALRVCGGSPAGGERGHRGGADTMESCVEQATAPDLLVRGRVH